MLVGYGGVAGQLFAHACWLGWSDGRMVGQTRILCPTRNNWGLLRFAPIIVRSKYQQKTCYWFSQKCHSLVSGGVSNHLTITLGQGGTIKMFVDVKGK